jgi:hypothetical protein
MFRPKRRLGATCNGVVFHPISSLLYNFRFQIKQNHRWGGPPCPPSEENFLPFIPLPLVGDDNNPFQNPFSCHPER